MHGWGGSAALVEGEVVGTETVDEILEGDEGFCICEMTGYGLDLVTLGTRLGKSVGDGGKRLVPRGRDETITLFDERSGQALEGEAIVSITSLVANPFFIHVIVGAWLYAHNADASRVDTNV